jgi:nicotinate-nucleotide adenylyltransferase
MHRLHMCGLAIQSVEDKPRVEFEVLDLEIRRPPGPSYSIETVRELKQQGWPAVHWLIGADMLNYLPKWHKAADLLREANFVIVARPGVPIDWTALPPEYSFLQKNLIAAPLIQISSTEIRQRVRAGHSINYLTPPSVVDYIRQQNLYRA